MWIADVDLCAEDHGRVVPVLAAALNPVDLAIAAGRLPFRRLGGTGAQVQNGRGDLLRLSHPVLR